MDQNANENQPASSDLAAQVAFAKDHASKGYQIIATALLWDDTFLLEDALRSQGVESQGIALDPLSDHADEIDADTVVIWGDTNPHAIAQAQPVIDLIEEKVRTGAPDVHVYFVKGSEFKLLPGPESAVPSRRKPLM